MSAVLPVLNPSPPAVRRNVARACAALSGLVAGASIGGPAAPITAAIGAPLGGRCGRVGTSSNGATA